MSENEPKIVVPSRRVLRMRPESSGVICVIQHYNAGTGSLLRAEIAAQELTDAILELGAGQAEWIRSIHVGPASTLAEDLRELDTMTAWSRDPEHCIRGLRNLADRIENLADRIERSL